MTFLFFFLVALVSFIIWRTSRKGRGEQRNAAFRAVTGISGAVTLIALLIAVSECFTVIPAGNVGVVDFFGTVQENTLKSGINPVNPFARIIKMSIQTQENKETMDSPSKEGLTTQIEVSVLFHLNPERAAEVYKTVGETYIPVLLEIGRASCRERV